MVKPAITRRGKAAAPAGDDPLAVARRREHATVVDRAALLAAFIGHEQHDFLAEGVWPNTAYGGNAIYDHGHHGNAILSRFPILSSHNQDISELRFERRGMLVGFGGFDAPPARSFPATLPMFRLDRIYVRGFTIERSEVHFGRPWSKISDHAALSAHIAVE